MTHTLFDSPTDGETSHLDAGALVKLRDIAGRIEEGNFVQSLLERFLRGTPERLQALRHAAAAGDCEALELQAHTLKSSCAYVGARVMAAVCQTLESSARAEDAGDAERLVAKLYDSFERIAPALQELLIEHSAGTPA